MWILVDGEVGRIWKEMRKENHDPNILYENNIHFQ